MVAELKTMLDDNAMELPDEEGAEKTLNLQENDKSASNLTESGESIITESKQTIIKNFFNYVYVL